MFSTKVLFTIIVILTILIYMQYYSKYNSTYLITQLYLDQIDLNILYERNPILIYDQLKNPSQLLTTLFRLSYLTKRHYFIQPGTIYKNNCKFSYVYTDAKQTQNAKSIMVDLINPLYKNDFKWQNKNKVVFSSTKLDETNAQYITIKLKPLQVLVLPSHWILSSNNTMHKIDLDDLISYMYFQVVM